jgi:hypothetical protein
MSINLTSAPQDDEQDYYRKNDHKNYEQPYYIGHPARRQRIIGVPIICFVFISFHVPTPLVSVPPYKGILPEDTAERQPLFRIKPVPENVGKKLRVRENP